MTDKLRGIISWWQIGCGALGLLGYALPAADWPAGSRRMVTDFVGPINVLGGIIFFGACIVFGAALKRGQHRGIIGSAICQAVQVVSFAFLGGPQLAVHSGPRISLVVTAVQTGVSVGFDSQFFLGTRISGLGWEVAVNFLALVWTVMLVRQWPRPIISRAAV